MIAEWTTLETTVNQIRLRLAAGFRAALSTKTPGLTTFQPILHVARICTASELQGAIAGRVHADRTDRTDHGRTVDDQTGASRNVTVLHHRQAERQRLRQHR